MVATALFYVQAFTAVCFNGSFDDLWALYYTVQIMVYLPSFGIVFPTNTLLYLDELKKLVDFQLLDPATIIRWRWDSDF